MTGSFTRGVLSLVARAALLLLCASPALAQQPDEPALRRLSLPGKDWALDIDLRAFGTTETGEMFTEVRLKPDKSGAPAPGPVYQLSTMTRLVKEKRERFGFLAVRMEPAMGKLGPAELRAALVAAQVKDGHALKDSVRHSEHKQIPVARYTVEGPSFSEGTNPVYTGLSAFPAGLGAWPGRNMLVRVMEAYLVRDDTWIRIRYFAPKLEDEDEKFFYSLLDSAKIVDTSRPSGSFDYFQMGRTLYHRGERAGAVAALEKALSLEQAKRELPPSQWRGLVMTLANALGAADDVGRAKEVLELGAAAEPAYPYFHHGLAKLHALSGDLDATLASLRRVYENAAGATYFLFFGPIPDPVRDPAFQQFKDDRRFRDAVKAMQKQAKK